MTGCQLSAVAGGPFAKGRSRSGSGLVGRVGSMSSGRRGVATTSAMRTVVALGAVGGTTPPQKTPIQLQTQRWSSLQLSPGGVAGWWCVIPPATMSPAVR
jgi:hypothetical protein